MGHVYSLRHYLLISLSWLTPFVLLQGLMIVTSWGQDIAKSQFNMKNPRPALEAIRLSHKLPGLGAAIVTDEGLQLLSTTGVRKKGDKAPVTDKDLWHIGSCGKALTATMIARLVEAGKISYEQTVGETFPELDTKMSDPLKAIKLVDLLSHTSGLPANFNLRNYVDEKNAARARRKVLREACDIQLLSDPGEKYLYSNWGYTLAGHMAEKATRKSWEALMQLEVFKPLKMSTAGFGGTGTPGRVDQPWPHAASGVPMPSDGKKMDNLPVMGPAGTMHMSLEDWGKFVSEHLKGHRGQSNYLSQASFQKLHTAVIEDAMGWVPLSRPWAGGNALFHNGDNTMNHAVVWAAPEKGFAVLIVTNQSSASQAADEVASGLLDAWASGDAEFPKLAPFNRVRWDKQQPVVRIGKQWCKLVSLNDLPATEIVAFSKETFPNKWQKRFEEDLVELLSRMGHPPQETVKLVVESLKSTKTRVLEDVPMTEENRQSIGAATPARANQPESSETAEKESDNLAIDAKLRRRLAGRYKLRQDFIFTVRDRDGHLMVGITNQPTNEVFPDSPTRWSYRGIDATLEFKLAKTGPAKSLVLHQDGAQQTARRIK